MNIINFMYYYEIFKAFHNFDIKYLLVGGLAVNLHGAPRVSQDLDVIILMERDNILKICNVLLTLDYQPRIPGMKGEDLAEAKIREQWIKEKNLKAVSFIHKSDVYKIVDIVLVHPLDFREASSRRVLRKAGEVEIPVASAVDLIKMKAASGRQQDLSDIRLLEQISRLRNEKR